MKWKFLAFAAGLGVLIMELGLRLIYPAPPIWQRPQVRHYQSHLLEHVLIPGSNSFSVDAPVSINRLGLRDQELAYQKKEGEVRVLALGDSFTFGMGVIYEDTWPEQLESRLDDAIDDRSVEVINAGVSGYGTRQELIYLLSEGLGFEPDLIVVGFYWNDLIFNDRPLPDLTLPRVPDDPSHKFDDTEHALPDSLRNLLRRSRLLYVINLRHDAITAWLNPPDVPHVNVQRALLAGDEAFLDPFWKATAVRLRAIAEVGREHGIPVVLVHFPMENEVRFDFPAIQTAKRLESIWKPTGMPFIDVAADFRASLGKGRNPYLPYDRHPNGLGMRIIADAIYDVIAEGAMLPPNENEPEQQAHAPT